MKSCILIIFFILYISGAKGAGSYTDLFHIGKIGTTANSILEIGDAGEFRYNFSTSKMQFSHDGINFYDVVGKDETVILTNKTFNVSNNLLSNVVVSNFAAGVIDTDLTTTSASDDTIPSAKAVKTLVDSIGAGTPALAKGGLITNNGSNDVAQSVGTNGFVLTADSGLANGIKWLAPVAPDHTISSGSILTNKTISSLSNTITNINTGDFQAGAIDTDLTAVSASDNTLASAKAIKTYVDASAGGSVPNIVISAPFSLSNPSFSNILYSPTITITSSGKPIEVGFYSISTDSGSISTVGLIVGHDCAAQCDLQFRTKLQRLSPVFVTFGSAFIRLQEGNPSGSSFNKSYSYLGCANLGIHVDLSPPAGAVQYRAEFTGNSNFGNLSGNISNCVLYAKEIK